MPSSLPPDWQLPRGVTRGLWEYVHSDSVADNYDDYFAFNRLFVFDEQVVLRALGEAGPGQLVADLGCGTGRALVAVCRRGFRGLAIDLSQRMLEIVQQKADDDDLPICGVRANMVELDGLRDGSVDHVLCLFSTLGMIRSRSNRLRVLQHAQRMLRNEGRLVIHVHNYWYNLFDPGGPWWVAGNLLRAVFQRDIETGDKFFPYRGVPNMYLHVFTRREFRRALRRSGFRIHKIIPLDPRRHRALRWPWLLGRLRANGWIVVCQKPT